MEWSMGTPKEYINVAVVWYKNDYWFGRWNDGWSLFHDDGALRKTKSKIVYYQELKNPIDRQKITNFMSV